MCKKRKPLLIIFEGVDKTGKSTLLGEFNKATKFSYVVLDRFTLSSKVYNKMYGRDRFEFYDNLEREVFKNVNVLTVLCTCKTEIIKERLEKFKEELPTQLMDIDKVKDEFYNQLRFGDNYKNYLIIDTSEDDISLSVNRIIEIVNALES
jgi:deoxyadenosine/deoxycytidine kinase